MVLDYLSFIQALRGAKNAQGINAAHNFVYVKINGLSGFALHMDSELKYRAPFRVIEPADSDIEFVCSLDLYKSISHFASLPNLVDATVSLDIEGYGDEDAESNIMNVVLRATLQAGETTRDVVTKQGHVCYTGASGLKERFESIIEDINTDLVFGAVDLTPVIKAFNLMGVTKVTEVGKLDNKFTLIGQDTYAEVDLEFGADFIESLVMPGEKMAVISKLVSNFKDLQVGVEAGEDINRLVLIETMPDKVTIKDANNEESEVTTNSGGLQACLEIGIPADLDLNLTLIKEHQEFECVKLLDLDCKLADILIKGIVGADSSKILEMHLNSIDEMNALFAGSTYNKTTVPIELEKAMVGKCVKVDYENISAWLANFKRLEFSVHETEPDFGKLVVSTGGTRLFLEVSYIDSDLETEDDTSFLDEIEGL